MQLELGLKIRALRRQSGRTQEALADALGVTPQAISRWEAGGGYPDMEMIPVLAHYFGVSIDELFGDDGDYAQKIAEQTKKLDAMIARNNGVDVDLDACILSARNALAEFPGNEHIMLRLASALYNAGYVRRGEHHITDAEGFDVYDTARHRTYPEWREAIFLYEKLLKTIPEGPERQRAARELIQLYANTGERSKALERIAALPGLRVSGEFLKAAALDGRERAQAYGEALLQCARACAEMTVGGVIAAGNTLTYAEKARSLQGVTEMFHAVCTDGNCGIHHAFLARVDTLRSLYLWLDGQRDAAFDVLTQALFDFRKFEDSQAADADCYTAPLLRLVPLEKRPAGADNAESAVSLAEDWPWWRVPEADAAKKEMQADPRWEKWAAQLRE